MNLPFKTLPDLFAYFNHDDKCRDFLEKMRWPDGNIYCPYCGCNGAYRYANGREYKCRKKECKARFSVTKGTMMESSRIPLQKWFAAAWLITNHKKGISSCQLGRDLGIGQKAAWFLLHRIREMIIETSPDLLDNVCMADEMYVGGSISNMRKTKRQYYNLYQIDNKTPVMGMIQRDGKARLQIIGRRESFKDIIRQNISENAIIVTDEHSGYTGLANEFCGHVTINHSKLEFKKDGFSTNAVEGLFSMFKRTVYGTYHQISVKHLDRYCQESTYRYNTRKTKDVDRFMDVMNKTEGRLTYTKLTGKKR
jgi:transposase-like protein